MPNLNTTTTPAPRNVAGPTKAKPAKAVAASGKPTTAPAQPSTAPQAVAKPSAALGRDVAGVARNATHYGATSSRDEAYLALYASLAPAGQPVTLAALRAANVNPFYTGSAKASDIGAINRARKAGNATPAADHTAITLTPAAHATGLTVLAKLRQPATAKPAATVASAKP